MKKVGYLLLPVPDTHAQHPRWRTITAIWYRAPSGGQTPINKDQIQEKKLGKVSTYTKSPPKLLTDALRQSKMADHQEFETERLLVNKHQSSRPEYKSAGNPHSKHLRRTSKYKRDLNEKALESRNQSGPIQYNKSRENKRNESPDHDFPHDVGFPIDDVTSGDVNICLKARENESYGGPDHEFPSWRRIVYRWRHFRWRKKRGKMKAMEVLITNFPHDVGFPIDDVKHLPKKRGKMKGTKVLITNFPHDVGFPIDDVTSSDVKHLPKKRRKMKVTEVLITNFPHDVSSGDVKHLPNKPRKFKENGGKLSPLTTSGAPTRTTSEQHGGFLTTTQVCFYTFRFRSIRARTRTSGSGHARALPVPGTHAHHPRWPPPVYFRSVAMVTSLPDAHAHHPRWPLPFSDVTSGPLLWWRHFQSRDLWHHFQWGSWSSNDKSKLPIYYWPLNSLPVRLSLLSVTKTHADFKSHHFQISLPVHMTYDVTSGEAPYHIVPPHHNKSKPPIYYSHVTGKTKDSVQMEMLKRLSKITALHLKKNIFFR